ncbi:hypothetical protein AgCh_022049 [Apium graveolens]
MLMFLEAIDDAYVDIIYSGPPYPQKVVDITPTVPEHYIRKEKSKWVIICKTARAIWDALETQCQGTMVIKKNRRVVLVQEYEQFDAKSDETITDIYDRFLTLLNDLSLYQNLTGNQNLLKTGGYQNLRRQNLYQDLSAGILQIRKATDLQERI